MRRSRASAGPDLGNRSVLTVCVILATLMQSLDSTIANVALPYMRGPMGASQDQINWVLTSYIVAAAIMTAPTGFLAARFGRTRLFVTSVVGFTLASILCGLAQSLGQIVIFRVLQGVFGAALVPLSQAVMFDIYPPERRGSAMALWGMGVMIGPILGPTLGGWLTENYNWRWVFYINVPFGMLAAIGLLTFLKETAHTGAVKLDWIGFGALSLAIGAFQTMLDRGELLDWFSSREIIVEACLAGLGLYCFVVQLALAPRPFLSPRLFRDLNFVVGITFIFIVGLILYATLALLTPYLQTVMDYPVVTAGVALAPRGAGTMLAMLVCGRLVGRVNVRLLVSFGFLATAYALYEMTSWTPDVSEWTVINIGFIQGVSIGFVFVPLSTTTFATLPSELRTQATGIYSLMRNIGSAIGISVTGALLQSNTQINHAQIAGAVTPFNRALNAGAILRFWNPVGAHGAAALNEEVTRQATIIAYVDDFKLMLILALASLPLVLLIRSTKRQAPGDSHDAVME
ncbi:MAG: DHA2 family efflux MFS transporter permease subunit [Acidisphaera sp.]|nr:DHA2 family efflux MFS transporter permease subunit [Acidisphaera sp.]